MHKVIIDANVWIKYARIKNIEPLLSRFITYNFLPVINNYLLSEICDALVDNKWMHSEDAIKLTLFIKKISLEKTEKAVYALTSDPKDNYLFDLAIQNNCLFIISDDKKLSETPLKQASVYSSAWFLKKFPI